MCVIISRISLCFFFFFPSLDNKQCLFHFLPVAFWNFVRVRICGRVCWFVCSNVHLLLFMYTPECLCMSCVAFCLPLWLRVLRCPPIHHDLALPFAFFDYLFNVCCHNQLQSFVTHDLRPFILSACYMPRELRPSDPNCLFIFPPTVSDRIHMLSGAALHTAPCLCVCWTSYCI